jgi:hypothetical protein
MHDDEHNTESDIFRKGLRVYGPLKETVYSTISIFLTDK